MTDWGVMFDLSVTFADLSDDEIIFLEKHGVNIDELINAKSLGALYKRILREGNAYLAINTSPCKKYGHKIRNRHGHCVQCNTAYFSHRKRKNVQGYLYMAYSKIKKIYKVGACEEIANREKSLNKQKYGCADDWEILFNVRLDACYTVENLIHNELIENRISGFRLSGSYEDARELYSFNDIDEATEVILEILSKLGFI